MKKLIYVSVILLLCVFAVFLTSCRKSYDITYELDGGVNSAENPSEYQKGETVKLGIAKKKDYAFIGWYNDPELENLVTKIDSNTVGDITLYAGWIKTEYALTFEYIKKGIHGPCYYLSECDKRVQYVEIPKKHINCPVTGIETGAFAECDSLEEVVMENSITFIGNGAFYGCESLKKITLGENITSIGDGAFAKCTSLKTIIIPNDVKEIGNLVFMGCTSLEEINIGELTSYISEKDFRDCSSLEAINVSVHNEKYMSMDGVLYSKDGSTLIYYPQGKKDSSFVVPDSVSVIGSYAFSENPYIENIILSDSVTSINNLAFGDCISLKSINIPSAVTKIGIGAFYNCSALTVSCQAYTKPTDWDLEWSDDVKEVIWGYKEN